MRDEQLFLAKTSAPLRCVWSWPKIDPASLHPTMVIVSREPDGRWYVPFCVETDAPALQPESGQVLGVDVADFAVTSEGQRIANPRCLERTAWNLAR